MRTLELIVIHCTATAIDKPYSLAQLTAAHKARNIRPPGGYHFLVMRSGEVLPVRPLNQIGAHALGYNANSVGIAYEGGIIPGGRANNPKHAKDTRTDAQKLGLRKAIKQVGDYFGDYQDMSQVSIVGHRDLSEDVDNDGIIEPWEWMKMCPCFDAIPEYKDFNFNRQYS